MTEKKDFDVTTIYDVFDYYTFEGVERDDLTAQMIKRLGTIVVAEELGGILPETEKTVYQQVSVETIDRVKEAIYRHPLEMIEKMFFPVTDAWRVSGYALFPNGYQQIKEQFLKEVSSVQTSSANVSTQKVKKR